MLFIFTEKNISGGSNSLIYLPVVGVCNASVDDLSEDVDTFCSSSLIPCCSLYISETHIICT